MRGGFPSRWPSQIYPRRLPRPTRGDALRLGRRFLWRLCVTSWSRRLQASRYATISTSAWRPPELLLGGPRLQGPSCTPRGSTTPSGASAARRSPATRRWSSSTRRQPPPCGAVAGGRVGLPRLPRLQPLPRGPPAQRPPLRHGRVLGHRQARRLRGGRQLSSGEPVARPTSVPWPAPTTRYLCTGALINSARQDCRYSSSPPPTA